MRNVALDLGARKICFCEVKDGKVIVRRTVKEVAELEDVLGPQTESANVAVEACREAWAAMTVLEGWGHCPLLVDTTRVKRLGVGEHGRKTDRIDAEVLALAVERGNLPLAHVLSPPSQALRHQLSVRGALVESRVKLVNTARGIARAMATKLPRCETRGFAQKVRDCRLSDELMKMMEPLIATIDRLDEQLAGVELALEKMALGEQTIVRLATTPGISKVTAATYVSVIDDAGRFRNAHQVESYIGLVPGESSSGGKRRLGAITKHGNGHLRAALIEAAWCIYRRCENEPLAIWARNIAKRRPVNVAVTALARRLAGILWAMWRDRTVYDPAGVAMATAKGLRGAAQTAEFQAEAFTRAAHKVKSLTIQAQRALKKKTAAITPSA
jgi:transposase